MLATFVLLLLSSHAPAPALSLPPRPPVRCTSTDGGTTGGCVLSNAYGAWSSDRVDCPVSAVAYPASEQEVVAAVARASATGARVKAVSGFAHTIPKLACPGGGNGTLLISTARLAGVEVDVAARTVTADAGAPLRAVIDAAEARGLSLTAAPYWEGVSVVGLVSTGSHGSSWWGRGGAVHDHVVGLRLVVTAGEADGWARVLTLRTGDELFPAALVSLGLLGVISKVSIVIKRIIRIVWFKIMSRFIPKKMVHICFKFKLVS
jgi:FAD-dependent oxidoreductase